MEPKVTPPTSESQPAPEFVQRFVKRDGALKCPKCLRRVDSLPHHCKEHRAR